MITIKSIIHDLPSNSVEVTWVKEITPALEVPESTAADTVDEGGDVIPGVVTPAHTIQAVFMQIKCHSYADCQMQMLRDDALALGTSLTGCEDLIALVESGIVPYVQSPEEIAAIEASRIASLWQAASIYESSQISGSAIGLPAMGVMQSLPKCIAVQGWIKSIWSTYYERKANGSTDCSFAMAGDCPHSVPELMVELGL